MTPIDILEQHAIDAAVKSQWELAIEINQKILAEDSMNLGACLRLGFACLQVKKVTEAKEYYVKALEIQPKNNIAIEHLEKIAILGTKGKSNTSNANLDPNLFLEMPGKTKTVKLVNLGQKDELAGLNIGQEVELKEKKRRLEVRSLDGEYIGCLPDDVSRRLMHFVNEESVYKTYIKETSLNDVAIFIREISKGPKVMQYPSFPSNPQMFMNDINHEENGEHEEDDDDLLEDEHEEEEEEHESVDHLIQVEDEDEDLEE